MKQSYKGMNPNYFVGLQSIFDTTDCLEDRDDKCDGKHLQAPNLLCKSFTSSYVLQHYSTWLVIVTCTITSGSVSPASGSSSNTATSMDQAKGAALNMMAEVAHQAVLPLLDRPLPIRKRQRKPNRKTAQIEADSPAVTSTIRKQGRKPKAAGNTHPRYVILGCLCTGHCACAHALCVCVLLICVCAFWIVLVQPAPGSLPQTRPQLSHNTLTVQTSELGTACHPYTTSAI